MPYVAPYRPQSSDPIVTKPHPEGPWVLHERICVEDGYRRWCVPAHFESDLASVPRALRLLIDESELGLLPAIAHDYLYRRGGRAGPHTYPRSDADRLFKELMKSEGVKSWKWRVAYAAVRMFGGLSWAG